VKYAVELCSVAIIYISSIIKIGSGIQKLIRETHRQEGNLDREEINLKKITRLIKFGKR
jgi:hypothetical protein